MIQNICYNENKQKQCAFEDWDLLGTACKGAEWGSCQKETFLGLALCELKQNYTVKAHKFD